MVSKKTLHAHRFFNIQNWFEQISKNQQQGYSLQALEMMEKLSKPQSIEFINWLNQTNPAGKEWMKSNIIEIVKRY